MLEELIKKVARAIFAQSFHPYDAETGVVDEKWGEWEQDRERAQSQAQAALSAIQENYAIVPREPTEAMLGAASEAIDTFSSEGAPVQYWRAMISAAERTRQ